MVVHWMYMIPRELFNIGGYQDKEHVDQYFRFQDCQDFLVVSLDTKLYNWVSKKCLLTRRVSDPKIKFEP